MARQLQLHVSQRPASEHSGLDHNPGLNPQTRLRLPAAAVDFDKEAAKEHRVSRRRQPETGHPLLSPTSATSDYSIKEYLAYQLYNLVTDMSFRVQGLDIAYSDGPQDDKPLQRFAFLIEDPDDVAKRNGLVKVTVEETTPAAAGCRANQPLHAVSIPDRQPGLVGTGWPPGSDCCHNARLIGSGPDADVLYPVPYDLDSSGLVDAHYASPADRPAGAQRASAPVPRLLRPQ